VRLTTQYLNHPALALGYRRQSGGKVVVYAVDHDPHAPNPAASPEGQPATHGKDQRHVEFLADADLIIHDALRELEEAALWWTAPADSTDGAKGAGQLQLLNVDGKSSAYYLTT
jgi:hypothetical protein